MIDRAWIEVVGTREDPTSPIVEPIFAWRGDPAAPVWVRVWELERGVYPWPLQRITEPSWIDQRVQVVRMDVPWWRWRGLVWHLRWGGRRAWKTFNARLIWTCVIWGLARQEMGVEPNWGWLFRRSPKP